MKRNGCEWTEAEIVDFVLGRLPDRRAHALWQHGQTCDRCRSRMEDWRHMLLVDGTQTDMQTDELPLPSERLRRRLRRSMIAFQRRKSARSMSRFLVPLCGFVVLLLASAGLLKMNMPDGPTGFQIEEHELQRLMEHPLAVRYPVESIGGWDVNGSVWIMGESEEMVLILYGLPNPHNKDYQAWLNKQNAVWDGGIVHIREGDGLLYFRGAPVREADNISVSLEPKGGSALPTGPQAFRVFIGK